LSVINNLFQIYFRLHNVRLCRNPVRSVENKHFPSLESFPLSQRVTFAYFRGRVALTEDDADTAAEQLAFCFERQPRGALTTKRRALLYLVTSLLAVVVVVVHWPQQHHASSHRLFARRCPLGSVFANIRHASCSKSTI
jgi:hypothetical protein